jgi:ABC-three component (ABC-3C) system Middle Component 6
MLLPDNIHPENSIYYNGGIVLNVIQNNSNIEILELFQLVKKVRNMSFTTFVLSLDWLYLIDVAVLENEKVKLCS